MKKLSPETIRKHKGVSFVGVVVTFFCYDARGKFLMAKRSQNARDEQGRWELGSGGVKHGATVTENLRRELKEEYSANPLKLEFLGYRDLLRKLSDGTRTHWAALDFAVLVNPKQIKINEPDMIEGIGWFTLDNLPSPLHSQLGIYFKKYKNRLTEILNDTTLK